MTKRLAGAESAVLCYHLALIDLRSPIGAQGDKVQPPLLPLQDDPAIEKLAPRHADEGR